ncbi:hypothetical protein M2T78_03980 [Elizabethkingia ursingii]|uniref:hypothetical protein n=1 Tax=Elizabethkingia ursingii TaxID=1756150 RepID=UPI0020129CA0|nr:hypothetical protein [Elizabethkingia ursingii]MCL1663398.1 hypothetical protein [Elizabethkingia ursingii]
MNTTLMYINTKFAKLFLLLSLIILSLSSCENRDTPISFNPPGWIKGEWNANGNIKYSFSDHDFVVIADGARFSYGSLINGNKSMINVIKSTSSEYIFEIVNYDITNTFNPPGSQNNTNHSWQSIPSRRLYFEFRKKTNNNIIDQNNNILQKY